MTWQGIEMTSGNPRYLRNLDALIENLIGFIQPESRIFESHYAESSTAHCIGKTLAINFLDGVK